MKIFTCLLMVIVSALSLRAQNPMPNMRINDDPSGAQQGGARIALDRSGTIYVAWTDFRSNGDGDIYLSKSTDDGATFSPNMPVYTGGAVPSGMQRGVAMAIDSIGGIHMVWMEMKRSNLPDLRYIRSTDGGATFSAPMYIGGPAGVSAQDFPSMGIDANNIIYVAWVDDRESRGGKKGTTQIYFTRSSDRGLSFSVPTRASNMPGGVGGSCECCNTSMAVSSDGHIYISFRSNIDNRRDIFMARSLNGGESFDAAIPVASERWILLACPMTGSAIVLDEEETAHIAWRDSRPSSQGKDYIYHAMLFYGETSCTPDMKISATPRRSNFPSIGITPDGAIFCTFQDNRNDGSDILSVYSFDGGNSFTAASNISDDPGTSQQLEPVSTVGPNGTRYTVWHDERNDEGDIYFAKDASPLTLTAPDRVPLISPIDAAVIGTFKKFSWQPPSNLVDARNVSYALTITKNGVPRLIDGIRATSYEMSLEPGSYSWSVVAYTPVGSLQASDTFSFTLSPDQGSGVGNAVSDDEALMLHHVSPNPATDELRVSFRLSEPETIVVSVIGMDGAQDMRFVPRSYEAGEQWATLDVRSLASGVYLLELRSSGRSRTTEFTVVR